MGRQLDMFLDGSNSSHYKPTVFNNPEPIKFDAWDELYLTSNLPFNVEREQTKLSAADLRGQNTKGTARLKGASKSRSKRNTKTKK